MAQEKNETVKIGWVGGITHEEDLKLIADDINASKYLRVIGI